MKIVKNNFNNLTIGNVYEVKFSMLQHKPEFIKIVAFINGTCTFYHTDKNGVTEYGTVLMYVDETNAIYTISQ
jgi:hypothetical protein